MSSIRDITSLRHELFSNLTETGFIPLSSKADDAYLNVNSSNDNLIKAVITGGLWPRVARVHLPQSAIKFTKIQAGTIQRENLAKEFKFFDLKDGRVFLHPTSVLFSETTWKSSFVTYFNKQATSKIFLRDATQERTISFCLFFCNLIFFGARSQCMDCFSSVVQCLSIISQVG
jgi:ATP-dependent RNA helicase DHX57